MNAVKKLFSGDFVSHLSGEKNFAQLPAECGEKKILPLSAECGEKKFHRYQQNAVKKIFFTA